MNNDIYNIDFTKIFPTALQHDPKMIALAKGFAAEVLKVSGHLNDVLIYSRFDELPEALVDILAYDMHVDWYDYDMPLKVKREVVKNSVRVHKRMGTKYAVETALGSVWPESEVEEWFEYGGEPHHFRIVCDVTESYITVSFKRLVQAVYMYKRLSSHLESVVYQARITCIIQTHTDYFVYHNPLTDTLRAGTHPYRIMIGGAANAAVIIGTAAAGFIFTSPQAGTVPQRNVIFKGREAHITVQAGRAAYGYTNTQAGTVEAGTEPRRAVSGGLEEERLIMETDAAAIAYENPQTGTAPQRNVIFKGRETAVRVETDAAADTYENPQAGTAPRRGTVFRTQEAHITAQTGAEATRYTNTQAGTVEAGTEPRRALQSAVAAVEVTAETEAKGSTYAVPIAGTAPGRNVMPQIADEDAAGTVEGKAFKYNSKRCGSPRKL